jgi:hypothetical protein
MNNDIWITRTLITMVPKYAILKIKSIKIFVKNLLDDLEKKND